MARPSWARPQQYGRLVTATSAAVKAAAPAATVVLAGTQDPGAGGRAWLASALTVPGADRAFDVASIHLRGTVERMQRRLAELRAQLRVPVWVTEHGRAAEPDGQAAAGGVPAALAARRWQRSGAGRVYVTLLDAPPGPYESEGIVAGRGEPGQSLAPRQAYGVVREQARRWAGQTFESDPAGPPG